MPVWSIIWITKGHANSIIPIIYPKKIKKFGQFDKDGRVYGVGLVVHKEGEKEKKPKECFPRKEAVELGSKLGSQQKMQMAGLGSKDQGVSKNSQPHNRFPFSFDLKPISLSLSSYKYSLSLSSLFPFSRVSWILSRPEKPPKIRRKKSKERASRKLIVWITSTQKNKEIITIIILIEIQETKSVIKKVSPFGVGLIRYSLVLFFLFYFCFDCSLNLFRFWICCNGILGSWFYS